MSAQTEPVDVLAVMDAACCVLAIDKCADPQKQLEKARAAIAELIQAAKLAERIIRSNLSGSGYEAGACTDGWCPEIREQVAALPVIAAALARVGGAVQCLCQQTVPCPECPSSSRVALARVGGA